MECEYSINLASKSTPTLSTDKMHVKAGLG
jgi:hypothetical protein